MEPVILTRPPLALVGLQIRTVPMSPEIPALWPRFVARLGEIGQAAEPGVTWGWMRVPPDDAQALLYLAAAQVSAGADVPEGMTGIEVPAAEVAVFEFPFTEIGKAYEFAFRTWLPASGLEQADGPLLERYGADFEPDDSSSPMQLHIPVRPRA